MSIRRHHHHQNNDASMSGSPMAADLALHMPVNAQPTEVLANRFASWRKIIRALNVYFKEVAQVQEEVVRHNVRLGHAVQFPFFANGTSEGGAPEESRQGSYQQSHGLHEAVDENELTRQMFVDYGNASISDFPGNVIQFHRSQAATASRTSKELMQNVIPRLEDLRRDLLVKIKEIKNLSSDFKNSVSKEQQATGKDLQQYVSSIDVLNRSPSLLPAKNDPYLVKLSLDRQLHRQLNEENYLLEAFLNLQNSGKELEKVIAQELQQAMTVFGKLMGVQGRNLTELLSNKVMNGFVGKEATFEWDAFIHRDPNFVDPTLKARKYDEVSYPFQGSLLAEEVKSGYLERRSKYLKSYSRAWYVLTPTFLHEFKSSDRKKDPHPVMSLSLSECQLGSESASQRKSTSHKFILNATNNKNSTTARGHNWVFRAENEAKLGEWHQALSKLTSMESPMARANSVKYGDPNGPPKAVNSSAGASSAALGGVAESAQDGSKEVPNNHTLTSSTLQGAEQSKTPSFSTTVTPPPNNHHQPSNIHTQSINNNYIMPNVSSPVPSDTSAVTSNAEPYQNEFDPEEEAIQEVPEEHSQHRPPNRGRFPSEVNLNSQAIDASKAADDSSLHREAQGFVIPSDQPTITNNNEDAADDNASVFSYDMDHPTSSTFNGDDDFKPVDADLPVEVERKLTQTSHKKESIDGTAGGPGPARKSTLDEPVEEAISKRRNSVKSVNRTPSRRATGSYGTGDELKPLSSANLEDQALFFAGGLPSTTGGSSNNST